MSHNITPANANKKPTRPVPFLSSHAFKPVFKLNHSIKLFAVAPKKYMDIMKRIV